MKTPTFLKIIYLVWGLIGLMWFTSCNTVAVVYNTMVLGQRVQFDQRRKLEEGGVMVHNYMEDVHQVM